MHTGSCNIAIYACALCHCGALARGLADWRLTYWDLRRLWQASNSFDFFRTFPSNVPSWKSCVSIRRGRLDRCSLHCTLLICSRHLILSSNFSNYFITSGRQAGIATEHRWLAVTRAPILFLDPSPPTRLYLPAPQSPAKLVPKYILLKSVNGCDPQNSGAKVSGIF